MPYIVKMQRGGYLREGLMGVNIVSEKSRATRFRTKESADYFGFSYARQLRGYRVITED